MSDNCCLDVLIENTVIDSVLETSLIEVVGDGDVRITVTGAGLFSSNEIVFTLDLIVNLPRPPQYIIGLYINGLLQRPADYLASGQSIDCTGCNLVAGDVITINYF
jgi:hypothetical protein